MTCISMFLFFILEHDMSTYSTKTFVFDLKRKRKFNIENQAVCHKPYGPCFGVNEFYVGRYIPHVPTNWISWIYVSGRIASFFGRNMSGEGVDVEVYYKV